MTKEQSDQPPFLRTPTRHALTGAEAVKIVSDVRAILWRVPCELEGERWRTADSFSLDKDRDLETLDDIVATLEDAGLAPTAPEPYQDVELTPTEGAAFQLTCKLADARNQESTYPRVQCAVDRRAGRAGGSARDR